MILLKDFEEVITAASNEYSGHVSRDVDSSHIVVFSTLQIYV